MSDMTTMTPEALGVAAGPRGLPGVVAIGRNEGDRLVGCLASVAGRSGPVVYVDSGSTDGSVEAADRLGASVVALDLALPFTAARARNAGLARLLEVDPDLEFVQFVDGDCEVVAGWLERAEAALMADPGLAVVCGRRRERHPEASIYNRLCDLEWDTPVGPAKACGGDALMRVGALRQVGGFDPSLIAGEEPELCVRLRREGWRIERIDAEMTLHDAAMTRFVQWWKRSVRAGHAFAEGAAKHGRPPERHWAREARGALGLGGDPAGRRSSRSRPGTRGLGLILLAGYLVPAYRAYRWRLRRGDAARDARLYAASCMIAKPAQALGAARYWIGRASDRRAGLIEYKT